MTSMNLIKVQTPVTDIKSDEPYSQMVLSGGLQTTDTINTASSFQLTPSPPISAIWTINPPSNQTIVDRRILVRSYLQFDFDQAVQIGTNDSLAFMPFNQLVENCQVTINGQVTSEDISDKLAAMMSFGNDAKERSKNLSMTAGQIENFQDYESWQIYGTARNVMSFYGENSAEPSRGGFNYVQLSPTRYQFEVTEPLFVSPLDQFGREKQGMVNVNQLTVNLRFKANTSRAWSHSTLGNNITSVQCTFFRSPELLVRYITPNLLDRLPIVQSLAYVKSNSYVKSVPTLTPNQVTTVISDSIRLSQIPRAIYLFCRHSDSSTNQNTPSSFLGVTNMSVNWCNQSSLFAQTTQQGLFEISANNGLNYDYTAWSKHRGGVVCLKPGKDFGLLDSESPGLQGSFTIQVQLTVKNLSTKNFDAQYYMVVVDEGVCSISANACRMSLGNLTPQMVLSAKEEKGVDYYEYADLQGGSFWSDLKNVVSKIARGVSTVGKAVAPVLGQYAPIASGVSNVADSLASALGAGGCDMMGSGYVGGSRLLGAGRLVGGRRR